MKRRLINYDVFDKMRSNSLTVAESELVQAEPIVAQALQTPGVTLHSFDTDMVLFEMANGTFVKAEYTIDKNAIVLEKIEQLVLDEESEKVASRQVLSEMLEALLEGKDQKAEQSLSAYLHLPSVRRTIKESCCGKKDKKCKKDKSCKEDKVEAKDKKAKKLPPFIKPKEEDLEEWVNLSRAATEYLHYVEFGPSLKESKAYYDERGNIVTLSIPTTKARNEAKLLSFDWDVPKTQVKLLRMKGTKLCEDMEFCKAVASLKKQNAVSDSAALEEVLENIVTKWPQVMYLTHSELSETIKHALEIIGAKNYDDQTCDFMAEGVLRTAHSVYVDRVSTVLKLAGTQPQEGENAFENFQSVVDKFYPSLDESNRLEMQLFVDLYSALRNVHETAKSENNGIIVAETNKHLNELSAIIRQEVTPSADIAKKATKWLSTIVETNLETAAWNASDSVHVSLTGEHPQMMKNARHAYTPASDFSGNWGDTAPVSDGKNYKGNLANDMRDKAWGNVGGDGTYPELTNPYLLKNGEFVIKGEKAVEKDAPTGQWSSGDTWPGLQNPYVLKAVKKEVND